MNLEFSKQANKKNIILITIDCLRADHLGCMGYKKNLTPIIDKLANKGIIFENAISNGYNTLYSVPSFLTSTLPPFKDIMGFSIAEILKENQYTTATFNPNPVILLNLPNDVKLGKLRLDKGFDTFDVMLSGKNIAGIVKDSLFHVPIKTARAIFKNKNGIINSIFKIYEFTLKRWPSIFSSKLDTYLPNAEEINKAALKWVKENKEKNFFLWIHYMDVHEPYASPYYENKKELMYLISKYRDFPNKLTNEEIEKLHSFYEDEIKFTDKAIGEFVERLKQMNCFENSIIIISADHGDSFNEHGALGHGTYFVDQLYDEILHVPLIIHGLGKERIHRQVELLDLAPTICEILDIQKPSDFEGISLFEKTNKGVISRSRFSISYRTLDYKLIVHFKDDMENELYDLKNDPEEKNNIYNESKDISNRLESEMISTLKNKKSKHEKTRIKNKIKELSKKQKI